MAIRVLHVFFDLSTGGVERLITDLSLGLTGPSLHVSAATYQDGPFGAQIREAGGDVSILGASHVRPRLARAIVHFRRLRALLSSGFDVVHTHSLGILWRVWIASVPRREWRWIHTEHIRVDVPDLYPPRLLKMAPMLLRLPDTLTGVSATISDYYLNTVNITADRIHCVPNGVDLRRFERSDDRRVTRRRLGIPDGAWLIGTVANLRREKDHSTLLRALVRVRAAEPRAHLALAGEGPMLAALEAEARDLGIAPFVHFLGARTDVPEILSALDLYCLPSRFEGMPISILEAMAAGCPIVATRVPGTVDLVEDGRTGVLVPPDDTRMLADQLLRVGADAELRRRLVKAARTHVAEHATSDAMLRHYARLYLYSD
jgi:glycosyltransferase involved in cell wall biosynthesis